MAPMRERKRVGVDVGEWGEGDCERGLIFSSSTLKGLK